MEGKIKRSLKYSFLDGIFASCMCGLVTEYITPYALALKANTFQIGLLNSIPNLLASLFQLKSPDLTERLGSRRRIINLCVFLHAFMLIPTLSIPFLFEKDPVFWLILFVTIFTIFGAFSFGPWASLISEYIPEAKRGQYFGWRNKVLGFITLLATFFAGFILQRFERNVFQGFVIIFGLASIFRFISFYFLTKMYEPELRVSQGDHFTPIDFIKGLKESNFVRFVIFVATLSFSVNIAVPFFAVLMLQDLGFSYATYTIVILSASLSSLLSVNRWGLHGDKVGNIKIIRLTAIFIAFIPFLWVICRNPLYLVLVQAFSGFFWAGFNLAISNFIFDSVSKEKRTRYISYFNAINGTAVCLGALTGGALVVHLPPLFGYRILSLLVISSILRLVVVWYFLRKITEVRRVEEVRRRDLLASMIGLKPILNP